MKYQYIPCPAYFLIFGISENITASDEKVREVAKWGNAVTVTNPYGVNDKIDFDAVSGLAPEPSGLPGFGLPKLKQKIVVQNFSIGRTFYFSALATPIFWTL